MHYSTIFVLINLILLTVFFDSFSIGRFSGGSFYSDRLIGETHDIFPFYFLALFPIRVGT